MADDFFQRIEAAAHESNRLGRAQLDELRVINHAFDTVVGEVGEIRRTQQEGLELQRAIFARDVFQDAMEDFVYKFQKTLAEFGRPETAYPPEIQFHQLRQIIEQVDRYEITTACIRGRDNKAAFDACLTEAREAYRQLARHPEVRQLLAGEEAARRKELARREAARREDKAREEAARRRREAAEARRAAENKVRRDEIRALTVRSRTATGVEEGSVFRRLAQAVLQVRLRPGVAGLARRDRADLGSLWVHLAAHRVPDPVLLVFATGESQINGEIKALTEQIAELRAHGASPDAEPGAAADGDS